MVSTGTVGQSTFLPDAASAGAWASGLVNKGLCWVFNNLTFGICNVAALVSHKLTLNSYSHYWPS